MKDLTFCEKRTTICKIETKSTTTTSHKRDKIGMFVSISLYKTIEAEQVHWWFDWNIFLYKGLANTSPTNNARFWFPFVYSLGLVGSASATLFFWGFLDSFRYFKNETGESKPLQSCNPFSKFNNLQVIIYPTYF